MSDTLTIYKLIILYILQKVQFPLTNAQISELVLGKEYADYFQLQSSLSELAEAGLIQMETNVNTTYYTLTAPGEETLLYFQNRIPGKFRMEIDRYIKENRMRLWDESSVLADYYKNTTGDYSVHCRVKEKYGDLIDLTISVPDEALARSMCMEWHKKSQPIYEFIMKELLP